MPPNKKDTQKKKVQSLTKTIEDKTFGMKNKNKSSKVSKMYQQASYKEKGNVGKKAAEEEIFHQKVHVSPNKTPQTICPEFLKGTCKNEKTCPFLHIQNEVSKPNKNICPHFMTAIDDRKYDWYWKCPNGNKCTYEHSFPSDKDSHQIDDDDTELSLEERLEKRRNRLSHNLPQINKTIYNGWIQKRREEILKREKTERKHENRALTGREIFSSKMITFDDDEGAFDAEELAERNMDLFIDKDGVTNATDDFDEEKFVKERLEYLKI